MFVHNWNSSNYIPFNQETGNEYRQFLQQRITNQQMKLNAIKNKFAKCHANDKDNKRTLATKIEKLEHDIECDEFALANLERDIKKDAELDEYGLFGNTVLGRSISAVSQAVAFPVVAALHFAEKHPILTGSMLIALQAYQALAAPIIEAVTNVDVNRTEGYDNNTTENAVEKNSLDTQTEPLINTTESAINNATINNATTLRFASTRNPPECLSFIQTKDINNTVNHKVHYQVINHCETPQPAHIVRGCHINDPFSDGPFLFSVPAKGNYNVTVHDRTYYDDVDERGNPERIYYEEFNCTVPVQKNYPLVVNKGCLRGYHLDEGNSNRAATYRMVNACDKKVFGYVESECRNGTKEFELSHLNDEKNITTKYFESCRSDIHEGQLLRTYQERFCKAQTDMPAREKVVGGQKVDRSSRNHLAYVHLPNGGLCTGSFITNQYVLTAAHCVVDEPSDIYAAEDLAVSVGTKSGPAYNIADGYLMSKFLDPILANQNRGYDLAVLKLTESSKEAVKVTLVNDEHFCLFAKELDKILVTNTGYPDHKRNGWNKGSPAWQQNNTVAQGFGYDLNSYGKRIYSSDPKEVGLLVKDMIQNDRVFDMVTPTGSFGTGISSGDSGGPLFYRTEEHPRLQVGVVVAADLESFRIFKATNIHHPETKEWIENVINDNPEPKKSSRLQPRCIKSSVGYDGFLGLITGTKKATFTNNCPFSVRVNFKDKKRQDMEGYVIPDLVVPAKQKRVVYGKGLVKPVFI